LRARRGPGKIPLLRADFSKNGDYRIERAAYRNKKILKTQQKKSTGFVKKP
jgi:hypothetical protein